MPPAKKITVTSISAIIGLILGILAVTAYASGMLDKKIDERIDSKLVKVIMYLEEIATQDQKKCVDEKFARWNKQ